MSKTPKTQRSTMIKNIKAQNALTKSSDGILSKLHRDFPQCFTNEGNFDIEKFKSFIATDVNVMHEGYNLDFLGKNYANLIACTETETVIQPDAAHNAQPENRDSQNIYISGDNLDALKHLLKSYNGSVKCIYIDPPYNTGSDGFVYADKFSFTANDLQVKLGVSEEKAAHILDLTRRGSASHSAWLTFMAPRLLLARDLLTDDGVIFISIDDNEQANLKLLCDSIFREENFCGQLIIQTATDNNTTQINTEHEYMLCYANNAALVKKWSRKSEAAQKIIEEYQKLKIKEKNTEDIQQKLRIWIKENKLELDLKQVAHYNNVDEYGVYSSSTNSSNPHPGGYMFDIVHPITGGICPKPENGWRWPETTFWEHANANQVDWGKDHTTQPHIKQRIETASDALRSIIYEDNRASTKLVNSLFNGKKVFDNPKPLNVLNRILDFATENDDIVIDFFSGSATTAHAIMQLNAENNGNRRFIAVQLPEDLDESLKRSKSEAKKTIQNAIEVCDEIGKPHTLDYVGYERIRRAAAKIKADLEIEISDMEKQLDTNEKKLGQKNKQRELFDGENPLTQEIETLKSKIESKRNALKYTDFGFKHYTLQDVSQNTLDKIEKFDPNDVFTDNDILQQFGRETVLETWLVRDGYGFGAKAAELKLAGYTAYHCGSHIYFIDEGFDENAMIALIDRYHSDTAFNPQNIVLFGYSFDLPQTEDLKRNLKTLEDSAKNLKINFEIRY